MSIFNKLGNVEKADLTLEYLEGLGRMAQEFSGIASSTELKATAPKTGVWLLQMLEDIERPYPVNASIIKQLRYLWCKRRINKVWPENSVDLLALADTIVMLLGYMCALDAEEKQLAEEIDDLSERHNAKLKAFREKLEQAKKEYLVKAEILQLELDADIRIDEDEDLCHLETAYSDYDLSLDHLREAYDDVWKDLNALKLDLLQRVFGGLRGEEIHSQPGFDGIALMSKEMMRMISLRREIMPRTAICDTGIANKIRRIYMRGEVKIAEEFEKVHQAASEYHLAVVRIAQR